MTSNITIIDEIARASSTQARGIEGINKTAAEINSLVTQEAHIQKTG